MDRTSDESCRFFPPILFCIYIQYIHVYKTNNYRKTATLHTNDAGSSVYIKYFNLTFLIKTRCRSYCFHHVHSKKNYIHEFGFCYTQRHSTSFEQRNHHKSSTVHLTTSKVPAFLSWQYARLIKCKSVHTCVCVWGVCVQVCVRERESQRERVTPN